MNPQNRIDTVLCFLKDSFAINSKHVSEVLRVPESTLSTKRKRAEIKPEDVVLKKIEQQFDLSFDSNSQHYKANNPAALEIKAKELTLGKLANYINTSWYLYFYDPRKGRNYIGRAILRIHDENFVELYNTPSDDNRLRNYVGDLRFDKSQNYLIFYLFDQITGEKFLSVIMYVGLGIKPTLCLGTFTNILESNGLSAGSLVFVFCDEEMEQQKPLLIKNEPENYEEYPEIKHLKQIRKYFLSKNNSYISITKKAIHNVLQLDEWLKDQKSKHQTHIDEKLKTYIGTYIGYYGGNKADKFLFSITHNEVQSCLQATLKLEVEQDRQTTFDVWTDCEISRYESCVTFVFSKSVINSGTRKIFLEIGLAGEKHERCECFVGVISGLHVHGKKMVSYKTLLVKEQYAEKAAISEDKIHKLVTAQDAYMSVNSQLDFTLEELLSGF